MNAPFAPDAGPLLDARFAEVEDLCQQVRLWDLDLRPLSKAGPGRAAGRVLQARARGLDFGHCRLNAAFDQYGAAPPGGVTFVIKDAGMGRLWWRGHDTDTDDILVYRAGSEVRGVNGGAFSIDSVSVSEDRLEGLLQSLKITLPPASALPEAFRIAPGRLSAIRATMKACRDAQGRMPGRDLQSALEELIAAWTRPTDAPPPEAGSMRARDRAIGICLGFLEGADLSTLVNEDLRRIANVSERTLEYAFRERFGATPARFVKARRMGMARRALQRKGGRETDIIDLATSLGFWHHGHFCADYRRAFGETPSDTRALG